MSAARIDGIVSNGRRALALALRLGYTATIIESEVSAAEAGLMPRPLSEPRSSAFTVSELCTVLQMELPSGSEMRIVRRRFVGKKLDDSAPRVAIVAGIRGDAPEGIRVAHEVGQFLEQHEERLLGVVDLYPCANPLAAHRGTRYWPFFDVDLNRLFPGRAEGHPPDRAAWALTQSVEGADQVIELRGARPAFRETAQAHVRLRDTGAAALAMHANVSVVWARNPGPAAPGTFAHQFPGTIVLEGGTGNRLTPGVGRDLRDGVLNLLSALKVVAEEDLPFHWAGLQRPVRVTDDRVLRIRADRGGLFLPEGELWAKVEQGAPLGTVIDPSSGEIVEHVCSPAAGRLLAVREHPVVFPGSMVARLVLE